MSLGIPWGSAGDGKFPRKVSAVLPRTPCTLLNNGTPPYFIIKENSLNCHNHYNDAIEQCVMIIPFLLYSVAFLLSARNFVSANIGLPAKEAARNRRGGPRVLTPKFRVHRPGDRSQRGVCITMTVTVSKDTTLCPNRRNLHRASKGVRLPEPETLRR